MRHVLVLALSGCTRILGVHDFPPEVDDQRCFGTFVTACFDAPLDGVRTLTGAVDTSDAGCRATLVGGEAACVIGAGELTIGDIAITGPLPLVLVARDRLEIIGTADAATRSGKLGPAANAAACFPATPGWDGQDMNHAPGGGAGGTFGGRGGDGGASGGGGPPMPLVGGGRAAEVAASGPILRGGCAGSAGGTSGLNATLQAPGGAGGGAIVLIADALIISGTVDASGAGGVGGVGGTAGPGPTHGCGGGGGGGSGGLVILDAASVVLTGQVVANGGGGGAGGSGRDQVGGQAGADGGPPFATPAAGGPGSSDQAGGDGAAVSGPARAGATDTVTELGSGGGGGGAGMILVPAAITVVGSLSPAPTPR